MRQANRKSDGFTMVELVVVMVVASILIAIAIPGYTSYMRTARRTDAKTSLLALAGLEERYFSTSNSYSSTPSDLGFPASSSWPQSIGSGYYNVTVSNLGAATASAVATYTITASAVGSQTKDTDCLTYSINQAGTKQASTNADGQCWN